jgi:hypothetical protein
MPSLKGCVFVWKKSLLERDKKRKRSNLSPVSIETPRRRPILVGEEMVSVSTWITMETASLRTVSMTKKKLLHM